MAAGYSLALPPFSRLPTHLYHHFEGSQALSTLYPHLYSRPRSRSPLCTRAHSHTCPPSRPRPRPCSRHRFPLLVPGATFSTRCHIVGQLSGLAPEAAGYLQAPPPVYGADATSRMAIPGLLPYLFPDVADTRALLFPSSPLHFRSLSRPRSRPCSCACRVCVRACIFVFIQLHTTAQALPSKSFYATRSDRPNGGSIILV